MIHLASYADDVQTSAQLHNDVIHDSNTSKATKMAFLARPSPIQIS